MIIRKFLILLAFLCLNCKPNKDSSDLREVTTIDKDLPLTIAEKYNIPENATEEEYLEIGKKYISNLFERAKPYLDEYIASELKQSDLTLASDIKDFRDSKYKELQEDFSRMLMGNTKLGVGIVSSRYNFNDYNNFRFFEPTEDHPKGFIDRHNLLILKWNLCNENIVDIGDTTAILELKKSGQSTLKLGATYIEYAALLIDAAQKNYEHSKILGLSPYGKYYFEGNNPSREPYNEWHVRFISYPDEKYLGEPKLEKHFRNTRKPFDYEKYPALFPYKVKIESYLSGMTDRISKKLVEKTLKASSVQDTLASKILNVFGWKYDQLQMVSYHLLLGDYSEEEYGFPEDANLHFIEQSEVYPEGFLDTVKMQIEIIDESEKEIGTRASHSRFVLDKNFKGTLFISSENLPWSLGDKVAGNTSFLVQGVYQNILDSHELGLTPYGTYSVRQKVIYRDEKYVPPIIEFDPME